MKARTVAKTLGGVAVLGVLFCIWLMWEPAIAPVKPSMPADKAAVARGRMVLEAATALFATPRQVANTWLVACR